MPVLASGVMFGMRRVPMGSGISMPPDSGTSMLYDRESGRPLEYDALTGAVVRAGERLAIDVPLNRALLALLRMLST